MKTHRYPWFLLPLAALLLSACSGLLTSDQPPRQVYLLQPSPATDGDEAGTPVQIRVTAVPGLDTDHILALTPDAQLSPYANARWADHLPEVLASVLQRSLEPTAVGDTVGLGADSAPRVATIDLELRAFYGIRSAGDITRSVRAELAGTLNCNDRTFELRLSAAPRVAEERLATVVAAHQQALDDITARLRDRLDAACGTTGP